METVHVVAINPYRKGNKGKVFLTISILMIRSSGRRKSRR